MDDGRLTDGKGRVVDFTNTIIILTSNVGADVLLRDVAKNKRVTKAARSQVLQRLRAHFLPEFLNRLDEVVVFKPLGEDSLVSILDYQVRHPTPAAAMGYADVRSSDAMLSTHRCRKPPPSCARRTATCRCRWRPRPSSTCSGWGMTPATAHGR
jgi:ATP-dependent Clp protease ATP-binding subunit ClpA